MAGPAALLLVLLAGAGCLGGQGGDDPDGDTGAGGVGVELPSGPCDPTLSIVVHRGGRLVGSNAAPIVACASKTGHVSREPTIGLSASGAVFHYPGMVADNTRASGVSVSHDRGRTWSLVLPDLMGVPTHPSSVDPYLYLDPRTDRVFADDLATPFCSYTSWSDDEGATWDHGVGGCLEFDHQTIFAGPPTVSSPTGYPNVVYRCAINAVMLADTGTMSTCQKSLDGGQTWRPFEAPAFTQDNDKLPELCGGAHGHGIADDAGTIYLPKGHCGAPMIAISDDEGASWRRVTVSTMVTNDHDVGVGVDHDGSIYATFHSADLAYLTHSSDGGATWSEPAVVSPPDVNGTRFQELAVGGSGRVAIVFYGTRQALGDPEATWEAMMSVSTDALADEPTFRTATFNDPDVDAYVVGGCCGGVQDFIDVRIGPDGTPWGAFVDDCIGVGRACSEYQEALDTQREGVAAWIEGLGSLWDDADPNGPYP